MSVQIDWTQAPEAAGHWLAKGDGTAWWHVEPRYIDVTTFADIKAGRPRQQLPDGGGGLVEAPLFGADPAEKLLIARPK
jgi:hypothetical protein